MNVEGNRYTLNDTRPYAFEFPAKVIQVSSISWEKDKDKEGNAINPPKRYFINRYSFVSEKICGQLIEWLDAPTDPVVTGGEVMVRFTQLRPSRVMGGFYELSGYPVVSNKP